MGFLFLAINIPKVISTALFLNIVSHLRFVAIGLLTRLGLFKPPPEDDYDPGDVSNNYILVLDGSSPSLVPIPVHVVTEAIKKRLPVITHGDFLQRRGECDADADEDDGRGEVCTICLDWIQRSHDIRELFNCSHVFHRDCLDTWVDEGQVYCPLCRSMLLPPKPSLKSISAGCAAAAAMTASAPEGSPVRPDGVQN